MSQKLAAGDPCKGGTPLTSTTDREDDLQLRVVLFQESKCIDASLSAIDLNVRVSVLVAQLAIALVRLLYVGNGGTATDNAPSDPGLGFGGQYAAVFSVKKSKYQAKA